MYLKSKGLNALDLHRTYIGYIKLFYLLYC
jgi:hypothetical protein